MPAQRAIIQGNILLNKGIVNPTWNDGAVEITDKTQNAVISGNYIENSSSYGIILNPEGENDVLRNISIQGNVINGTAFHAIYVIGAHNISITGNQISGVHNSAYSDIALQNFQNANLRDILVSGNQLLSTGGNSALRVIGSTGTNLMVSNNVINGSYPGYGPINADFNPINIMQLNFIGSQGNNTFLPGNVGIGTSAPTQKLEVNGGLRLMPAYAPAQPTTGTIFFDGTHFFGYNGSAWKQLDN